MSEAPARRATWLSYATWTTLILVAGLPAAARLPESPGPIAAGILLLWAASHALVLASATLFLGAVAPGRWRLLTVSVGTFAVVYVWVDALLVALMGQHFRWGALRHVAQREAMTTLGISASELVLAAGLIVGVVIAGAWSTKQRPAPRGAAGVLLLALLLDGACSLAGMVSRFEGIGQLTGLHESMPLAWAPRDDLLLARWTGHPPKELESTFMFPEGGFVPLRRPIAPQPLPEIPRQLDVLLVVVESLRADALADMPALEQLAARSLVGEDHFSAGNCTLVGAFSLYTGLSPMFMTAEETWRSGVGLEAFARAGYDVKVSASASLNMELPERILSSPSGVVVGKVLPDLIERDERNMDRAIEWLGRPQRGAGLFALFLDGTHWPYSRGEAESSAPRLDDSWLVRKEAAGLHERYRRRVRELSARLERLVAATASRPDDLVIVITGDHGEAFGEHGVLMHGSRLDDEQLRVPLIMHLPGVAPGKLPGPSVHQDILPTILGYLGAKGLDGRGGGIDLRAGTPRAVPPVVGCCGFGEPVGYALLHEQNKVLFTLTREGLRYQGELGPGDVALPTATPSASTQRALAEVQRDFFSRLR